MSHPAGPRDHAFRTVTDTRSDFTPAPSFRTNAPVPFADFEAHQARLKGELKHLNTVVAKYSKPRKNRTPGRQAADKETRHNFDKASESVDDILHRLRTTFSNERAWSKADKADMPSSVYPDVKEGFIKTFQASLTDSLVELYKEVQELVKDPLRNALRRLLCV